MLYLRAIAALFLLTVGLAAQGSMNINVSGQNGSQTTLELDLNHNPNSVVDVWVDGVKLAGNEYSTAISGTKVTVTFGDSPAVGVVVTVKIEYSGSTPTLQGEKWS